MRRTIHVLAAIALAMLPALANAQDNYPTKSIKIVAPYPPGGTTDILARAIANGLTGALGQSVIVENKVGASGLIGHDAVAKAAPDGYTIVLGNSANLAVAVTMYQKMPFDPVKDLAPITLAAGGPLLLVVNPALPIKSFQDLIDYAKKNPGKMNAATVQGSMHHLLMEMVKLRAGVQWTLVPYKGSAPMITDTMGGQTDFAFDNFPSSLPQAKSGRLRAIAVSSAKRTALLPDMPTVIESGLPGVEAVAWHGVLAPAGTPQPIIKRLNAEIVKILRTPELVKNLGDLGLDVIGSSPEEFSEFIKTENVKWAKVVKESGAKLE